MPPNPKLLIKICGIKDTEVLDCAIESGADMVGFVHFARSPRHLDLDQIGKLILEAGARAKTVVLLVDPDDELVGNVSALNPDYVQLHGRESVERVAKICAEFGVCVMKVLPVGGLVDLREIGAYSAVADRILLDAKPPKDATRPGGLGEVFDWDLLKSLDPRLGFMLSGGLNPNNVGEAVTRVGPLGIDVSSGVESVPGKKDKGLIKAFIANARAAEKQRSNA